MLTSPGVGSLDRGRRVIPDRHLTTGIEPNSGAATSVQSRLCFDASLIKELLRFVTFELEIGHLVDRHVQYAP